MFDLRSNGDIKQQPDLDVTLLDPTSKPEENQESELASTMKSVVNYFNSVASVTVTTPLKGTCMQVTKDETNIILGSRKGRLTVINSSSKAVVTDEKVSEMAIQAIVLSVDDSCIYAGGDDKVINKHNLRTLGLVDSFQGHTAAVTSIMVSSDNRWLFSASKDTTVRMWAEQPVSPRDKVLYSCKGEVTCLDLCITGTLLCSGGTDKQIYVYELYYDMSNPGKMLTILKNEASVLALKFSYDCGKIFSGDSSGDIKAYKCSTWEVISKYSHGGEVVSLDTSMSGDILISAGDKNIIKVWNLFHEEAEVVIKKHTDAVVAVKITKDQLRIISIGNDKNMITSKIPQFEEKKTLNIEGIKIVKLWHSKSSKLLEGIVSTPDQQHWICDWDSNGNHTENIKLDIDDLTLSLVNFQNTEVLAFSNASQADVAELNGDPQLSFTCLKIFNIGQRRRLRAHLLNLTPQSAYLSDNSELCFIGESFKVTVWRYSDFSKIKEVFAHNGSITQTLASKDLTDLFTFGVDSKLKRFDLSTIHTDKKPIEMNNKNFTESINDTQMLLSDDGKYIYLLFIDSCLQVIEVETLIVVLRVEKEYKMMIKGSNGTLMVLAADGIDIYSCKSLQLLCNYMRDFKIMRVLMSEDLSLMYIQTENQLLEYVNPLRPKSLSFVGSSNDLDQFLAHVNTIIDKSCEEMYLGPQFLIEPAHINLLHLYAYFNMSDVIKEAIRGRDGQNNIAFMESLGHFSPLTIALQMNFTECIHSIISAVRKEVKEVTKQTMYKKFLFQYMEGSITSLNNIGYKGMHKLYRDILENDTSEYLPNFCDRKTRLPMVIKSNQLFPNPEEFNLGADIPEDGKAVVFYRSLLKLPMEMGSSLSLEFMDSLGECSNEDIFDCKIIKLIIAQKWVHAKKYIWVQAGLYLIYMLLLCLYTANIDLRTKLFLIAPLSVSCVLYAYELIFVIISFTNYFQDFWNVVDSIRAWLMIGYAGLVWSGYFVVSTTENTNEKDMLALLLFVSWMRGITYFRLNASTRYLIKLLFQVCSDIVPFLIVLFYSIVAFGLILDAFDSEDSDPFLPWLTSSYMIILGGWDNPTSPDFYSVILLLATMLNPIISLNMLISILADTFEQVSENQLVADSLELIGMIIEIETLMFWNRNKNAKNFLQSMEDDTIDVVADDELVKQIDNIRSKIGYLDQNFKFAKENIERSDTKINKCTDQVMEKLQELLEKNS